MREARPKGGDRATEGGGRKGRVSEIVLVSGGSGGKQCGWFNDGCKLGLGWNERANFPVGCPGCDRVGARAGGPEDAGVFGAARGVGAPE